MILDEYFLAKLIALIKISIEELLLVYFSKYFSSKILFQKKYHKSK
jgi:hypothetical protein